jgi:hypothetical protein
MKREEERIERVVGKGGGGPRLFLAREVGLADGGRADAIPNTAPDGVIHWYFFYLPMA